MNKLELFVKIAAIEKIGFQVIEKTDDPFLLSLASQKKFDPIEDDGLCHRLMIKHGINIQKLKDREFSYLATYTGLLLGETGTAYSNIANEAICLAIVDKYSESARKE